MSTSSAPSWPYLRLNTSMTLDDEHIASLAQTALDRGALGSLLDGSSWLVFLPQDADHTERSALRSALEETFHSFTVGSDAEWHDTAWQWETMADQPWATAWKDHFESLPVGKQLVIRPDWEVSEPLADKLKGRLELYLRPGFGFGTGKHETTRLALTMLERYLRPGKRMLDFGSGSGILSIAAAIMGMEHITAIEFDPEANLNARENFELNNVHDKIVLYEQNHLESINDTFDLILCNMLPQNAMPHLSHLTRLLSPKGELIYCGFLTAQREAIHQAIQQATLEITDGSELNEWGVLVARPSAGCATKKG